VPSTAAAGILSREDVCAECARHVTEASATPSLHDVLTSEGSWQKFLARPRQSRLMAPAGLFVSQRRGSHSSGISCITMNCFVCRWFCVVLCLKPLLHHHNWLSFGKYQDTVCFLIPCPHNVLSQLPLAVKPASTPWCLLPKQTWWDSLPIDTLLSAVSALVAALLSSAVLQGLMNYPVCDAVEL
jgi:hypothetical protein